jgi:plastocyanin
VLLVLGLAACSGGSAAKADVTIENFVFTSVPVAAGSTVTVTNKDPMTHTVTADKGGFSVTVNSRSTATFTAPGPGTYKFHCNIHPTMHGSLTVG